MAIDEVENWEIVAKDNPYSFSGSKSEIIIQPTHNNQVKTIVALVVGLFAGVMF